MRQIQKYRGSALYFRLAIDKKIYENCNYGAYTEMMRSYNFSSKERKIHNFSVFRIILTGYKLQNILINKIKNKNYKKIS